MEPALFEMLADVQPSTARLLRESTCIPERNCVCNIILTGRNRREIGATHFQLAMEVTAYPPSAIEFMELALEQAKFAFDNLEVPIGCVIVKNDKVIASGSNRTTETRNATRHAEMEAIDFLLDKWQKDGLNQLQVAEKFSRCDLYVTCEPCIMCATALSILGIREVYYGCANDKFGGCGSILALHQTDPEKMSKEGILQGKGFKCTGGLMSADAVALLRSFYEQGNPNGTGTWSEETVDPAPEDQEYFEDAAEQQ